MNLITIIAVLLISLLFTIVFVGVLKSRGPWGSGWSFFSIVSLWLTAVTLWIPPAAPVWFGVPWIDLILTALLVSFVLSATSVLSSASMSSRHGHHNTDGDSLADEYAQQNSFEDSKENGSSALIYRKTKIKAGGFFWMLLLCLAALIIIGAA